jgi:serine/threonine protein kinase
VPTQSFILKLRRTAAEAILLDGSILCSTPVLTTSREQPAPGNRQAAIGLEHAHEHKLVHRDIKPSNLMLTADGQLKILALGLARLLNGDRAELTSSGQMMGTVDYMAPEQFGDSHEVDIRADIYSLGATLYKLLSGQVPFSDEKY